jgi:hypothetical protein
MHDDDASGVVREVRGSAAERVERKNRMRAAVPWLQAGISRCFGP